MHLVILCAVHFKSENNVRCMRGNASLTESDSERNVRCRVVTSSMRMQQYSKLTQWDADKHTNMCHRHAQHVQQTLPTRSTARKRVTT